MVINGVSTFRGTEDEEPRKEEADEGSLLMTELRIFYERASAPEGDASAATASTLDVFTWLTEAHPPAMASYGSSNRYRQTPEARPDDYIDLRSPKLGLKLRGGLGRRQQGLELKVRESTDSATGIRSIHQ